MIKKASALMMILLCGGRLLAAGDDHDTTVSWKGIAGVITAPNIDNPVAVTTDANGGVLNQIHAGTLPWVAKAGSARVDLATGAITFTVKGLVLNGGNASGTAGPINQVVGTVVCNPGSTDAGQPQTILDTPPAALSSSGNATFVGQLTGMAPLQCNAPLFLIRIGPAFGGFAGRWLATGVEPASSDDKQANRHDADRD